MAKVCWQCGSRFRSQAITRAVVDAKGVTRVYRGVWHFLCPRCGYSYHDFSRAQLVREVPPGEQGAPALVRGESAPARPGEGTGGAEAPRPGPRPRPEVAEKPEG